MTRAMSGGYRRLNPGIVQSVGDPETQTDAAEAADTKALLLAVAAGDRQAFTCLYQTTSRLLYAIALRITHQADLADDVLSETYLQVWRQASRFDPARGTGLAWLSVICRSRALDTLRQHRQADALTITVANQPPGDSSWGAQLLASVELSGDLHLALSQLQEEQRQLLGLAYFRDLSHRELAVHTGLPLGTVKSQLRRGMEKLRKLMNRESYD